MDKFYFDEDENANFYVETIEKKLSTDHFHVDKLSNKKYQETLKMLHQNQDNIGTLDQETLKNIPSLLFELQEALKKSNSNILDLKETISELMAKDDKSKKKIVDLENEIKTFKDNFDRQSIIDYENKAKIEKQTNEILKLKENFDEALKNLDSKKTENKGLKKKIQVFENQTNFLQKEIDIKEQMTSEMNGIISTYKKTLNDHEAKNSELKANNLMLNEEMNKLANKFNDLNEFSQNIQFENDQLRIKINNLEGEIEMRNKQNLSLKESMKNEKQRLKQMKEELKSELNQKIDILRELDNLKNSQKEVFQKQEDLKTIIESSHKNEENLAVIEQLKLEIKRSEFNIKQLVEEKNNLNEKYLNLKNKYKLLINDFEALQRKFEEITSEISNKKVSEQEIYRMSDKYEEEIFNYKCEINLWKNALFELARFKLLNIHENDIEEIINIDRNYINNASPVLRERIDNILNYFKNLIEEEVYISNEAKDLKKALMLEQEKILTLNKTLSQETNFRRRIQEKYMNIRGNLRIMLRIRPFLPHENSSLIKKSFIDNFRLFNNQIIGRISEDKTKVFDFDYIFKQNSTQIEVYDEVSLMIQSMFEGKNVCIFAYGQTCTGKTYTIQGPKEDPGLVVRSAKQLFDLIENMKDQKDDSTNKFTNARLSISIIEIYNENIYNLLVEGTPQLSLYENSVGSLIIPDLNPISISNFAEARRLFKLAEKLRQTKQTNFNDSSSRSHLIFSYYLKLTDSYGNVIRSKLNILDLAGSERLSRSGIIDENLKKELISINLSLNAFGNVLNAIASKQNHVPYRDSKLTHFLKDSMNENYNILMLIHISPNPSDVNETICSLDFATRIGKMSKFKTATNHSSKLSDFEKNENEIKKKVSQSTKSVSKKK